MKTLVTLLFGCFVLTAISQPNKKAKMAAVFVPGYYINNKNDTVRGQLQINPEDLTDFYSRFAFISGRAKKPKMFLAGQTKAYGFEGRNFVSLNTDGQKLFVERLVYGRLRFYEYRYNGKINGSPGIESVYYIRDMYAEGENDGLKEPRKMSHKFYKKSLKPYLQDQPMLWSDLDKYTFNRDKVVQTINEFNQFYASTSN